MKLVGFTSWLNENYQDVEESDNFDLAWGLTVEYMKQHGLKFSGYYHQMGEFGAPYFDTNQKLCLSFRAWGMLMAEVLNITKDENDERDMSYCKWAWSAPTEEVLPRR